MRKPSPILLAFLSVGSLASCCDLAAQRIANPTDRIDRLAVVGVGCPARCPLRIPPYNYAALLCPATEYSMFAYVGYSARPRRPVAEHPVQFEVVEFLGAATADGAVTPAGGRTDGKGVVRGKIAFGNVAGVYRIKASFPDGVVGSTTFSRPIIVTRNCGNAKRGKPLFRELTEEERLGAASTGAVDRRPH